MILDDQLAATTTLPTTFKIDENYQALCDKKTGHMEVAEPLLECLNSTFHLFELIEDARHFNKRVVQKYCSRKPILIKCMTNYVAEIEPCLAPAVLKSWKIQKDVIEKMLDAFCFDRGSTPYGK